MSKELKVPELGENVESGTVAKVLVSEGDTIQKEQAVVELESEKAVAELPSEIEGTIEKIHVKEGDEVKVGQTLLTVGDSEGGEKEPEEEEQAEEKRKAEEKKEDKEEETKKGEEKEPEEKTEEKPSEDQEADRKQKKSDKRDRKQEKGSTESEKKSETERRKPFPAAPSVRRFAREIGVDISTVSGSGPQGRISVEDVKKYARSGPSGRENAGKKVSAAMPDFSQWGETEREGMNKVRRLTAEHTDKAWSIIPHATQFGKARIGKIEELRTKYKEEAEDSGGHLGLTVILMKTIAGALKHFPRFNASVDMESNEIIYKKYYNIGVAVDTERGLVVPVIRDIDKKNIIELSVEFKEITGKAREGKLGTEDMRGGNFTITNAGALGGDVFVPIVNWPEVAILGVGKAETRAVFKKSKFEPEEALPLSLSYDHRIVDGADAVRFMNWIVEALEEPVKLIWEG